MFTVLRPRLVPNSTAPAERANRVSSPPRPTPTPGWNLVPRWRTRISPALTSWPPKRLTPRRCALESRPLRVLDAPFLLAMSESLLQGARPRALSWWPDRPEMDYLIPVILTTVSFWRWPCRLWYPVLCLNVWIRIFGPLVCSTISPETVTLARASASEVTAEPSATRIGDSDTEVPASPSIFSTLTWSPSATLYCLPPVLTIAYMEGFPLLLGCVTTQAVTPCVRCSY